MLSVAPSNADPLLHGRVVSHLALVARLLGVSPPRITGDPTIRNVRAEAGSIAYNPKWIAGRSGSAELMGALAHEIAHLIFRDADRPDEPARAKELRADQMAGRVLAAAQIDPTAFRNILRDLDRTRRPAFHPRLSERLAAVDAGYTITTYGARWPQPLFG